MLFRSPVIFSIPREEKLRSVQSIFSIKRGSGKEAVIALVNDSDEWLAACALYWIYLYRDSELFQYLNSSTQRTELLVRQTAQIMMQRLNVANG